MELAISQDRTKAIAKSVAIAITFAVLYFIMCVINPFNYLTGAASLATFANIRWANILKSFALVSPASTIGIFFGSRAFDIYTGKAVLAAYPIMPMIYLALGLGVYWVSQKWGRSTAKDLTILTVFAVITALLVSMNLIGFAAIFGGTALGQLFTTGVLVKVLSHIVVFWAGYPIVRMLEKRK
jgi:hypothetical protein